ncbi:MAG: heavy metal translocating P-type ATPase [bacterium]
MIFHLILGVSVGIGLMSLTKKKIQPKKKVQQTLKPPHAKPDTIVPQSSAQQPQQSSVSSDSSAQSTSEEEPVVLDARKNFLFASSGTLLALAGSTIYAPLYVPSMLLMAYPFRNTVRDAYTALVKEKRVGLDMLVAVEVPGAILSGHPFVGAAGIWFQRLMRLQLAKTQNHSRQSLVNLFGEQPRTVWVLVNELDDHHPKEIEIPFEQVKQDDQVIVTAGQTIPIDGIINKGIASIDQHMLTGESQPAQLGEQNKVFAGTIVLSGSIIVRVTEAGTQTMVAQIGEILNNTADFDHTIRTRVEKMQDKLVPQLFLLSGASLPWLGMSGAMAILWYHPGFRMTIFGPMSMVNFLRICSQKRILVKDSRSLERVVEIDTVVFDKTGTLTVEQPTVSQISCFGTFSEAELLSYAAAAEYKQTHPVALAILTAAKEQQLRLPMIDDSHYEMGYGIKVNIVLSCNETKTIHLGSDRFMRLAGIAISPDALAQQAYCHEYGHSLVMIAIDGELSGAIELRPTVRPEAQAVVSALQAAGKQVIIISGDHDKPTQQLATTLGIDQYFASVLPEGKADLVKQLQQTGKKVCFIGDGINDAIALKQANVSVSLSGATTIATDSAQIVLMDENLTRLPELFALANELNTNMNTTYLSTIIPSSLGIVATLFLHWGFVTAVLFNGLFWLPQLVYVMYPMHKHKTSTPQLLSSSNANKKEALHGG